MTTIGRRHSAVAAVAVAILATGASSRPGNAIPGVRFTIDSIEIQAPAARVFSLVTGRIEYAAGRGRIDVSAVALKGARTINDVTLRPPLAQAGDFYLFDSTGYILVRPSMHTFSSVSFTALTYRLGNVREAWDDFFEFGSVLPVNISPNDTARLTQHGPFGVRWHLDRMWGAGPAEILARGRVLVADAPRGEASVARWMAVSAALATLRDSIKPLDTALRLTAVAVLPAQSKDSHETNLILLHPMSGIAAVDIDVTRLVLPAGYTQTPWPGFERVSDLPARASEGATRWLTIPHS